MILSYFLPLSLCFNQRRKQEERLKPVSGTSCWGIMRCRSVHRTWKHVWCLVTKLNKSRALAWISWCTSGLLTLCHLSFWFSLQRGSWVKYHLRFKVDEVYLSLQQEGKGKTTEVWITRHYCMLCMQVNWWYGSLPKHEKTVCARRGSHGCFNKKC